MTWRGNPERVVITGAAGQDGTILAALLARTRTEVVGLVKPGTDHQHLSDYAPAMTVLEADLADFPRIREVIREVQPARIWNFGGFTAPGESWTREEEVLHVNVEAVSVILESAATLETPARVFQASSSHIFEGTDRSPQTEDFELSPVSPYARSKAAALELVRRYRNDRGLFAVSAIMYNHESPLRSENFVTRKITKAVARIAAGLQETLELGDIEVARDWGWAPDYVQASIRMMDSDTPRDYVLGTGISHRLSFFVQRAFLAAGITDWHEKVVTHASDRKSDTNKMVGDARSAYRNLGWRHTVDFDGIAARMVAHDRALLGDPNLIWRDF